MCFICQQPVLPGPSSTFCIWAAWAVAISVKLLLPKGQDVPYCTLWQKGLKRTAEMLRWHGNTLQLTSLWASQWHQTPGPFPVQFGLAPVTIDGNLLACQKNVLVVFYRSISNPQISLLVNTALCHCFTRSQAPKPTVQCSHQQVSIHVGALSEFSGFFPTVAHVLVSVSIKHLWCFMGNV